MSDQPPQFAPQPPAHPQSTTALILGILGIVLCGLLAPFAWFVGNKAVDEIDRNPGLYSGRGEANAGKVLGIIGTVMLGVGVLFVLGAIAFVGIAAMSSGSAVN
jgi:uncharacterized membrane protein YjgN (DUF898 family)